jgi:hypothetical protein
LNDLLDVGIKSEAAPNVPDPAPGTKRDAGNFNRRNRNDDTGSGKEPPVIPNSFEIINRISSLAESVQELMMTIAEFTDQQTKIENMYGESLKITNRAFQNLGNECRIY